ncbi:hypothetical protein M408DRAFT_332843, partial [Serendipita vermifera MAFF 305830]
MARTQLKHAAVKSAKRREKQAPAVSNATRGSGSSGSSGGSTSSVILEKKLGLLDILGTNERFMLIDWLVVIEKTVIKTLEMIQTMPGQIGRLEKIKKTLEDHWSMVKDAQTWPGYRQGQAPPAAVVDQALSSIKDYLMQVELILEELWSLGGSSDESGPTIVQTPYEISEEDVSRYSEDLNSSFQWLERLLLYMKSDAQMRSTEADLLKAIEEQTAAMQSFSIQESSGTVTLTAWPWVDENSEARFPSSRPSRAQLVEPSDLSDAISHKSTLPKYAGPYSLVYTGEYEGTTVAIKVLQSPGVTTH